MNTEKAIEASFPQLIEAIKRLVRIDSPEGTPAPGAPFGNGPAKALAEALRISSELGFKTGCMDNYAGWAEYGSGDELVVILGHLDIVPDGDGWTVCKPFEPVVKDNKLYGRGTIDDKGPTMAALFALKALVDTGFTGSKRVRVLFGCNEETGSRDMEYYCAHGGEMPVAGFTPDGGFPLINGEKGLVIVTYEKKLTQKGDWKLLSLKGGTAANVVPAHASAEIACPEDVSVLAELNYPDYIHVTPTEDGIHVEAEGVSAHGSTPEIGVNAIGRLLIFLAQLPFDAATSSAIQYLADKIGTEVHGEGFGIDLKDDISGELSFNLGTADSTDGGKRVVHGKENYNGAKALRVTINYRWPVTYHYEDCAPALNNAMAEQGWKIVAERKDNALYCPADNELVQKLLAVYRKYTGDMTPAMSIGGGTYAKSIPNILAFGPVFPGEVVREHESDEFIDLDHLLLCEKIFAEAIRALAE